MWPSCTWPTGYPTHMVWREIMSKALLIKPQLCYVTQHKQFPKWNKCDTLLRCMLSNCFVISIVQQDRSDGNVQRFLKKIIFTCKTFSCDAVWHHYDVSMENMSVICTNIHIHIGQLFDMVMKWNVKLYLFFIYLQ